VKTSRTANEVVWCAARMDAGSSKHSKRPRKSGKGSSKRHEKRSNKSKHRQKDKKSRGKRQRLEAADRAELEAKDEDDAAGRPVLLLKLRAIAGPFRGIKFEIDQNGTKIGRMATLTPTYHKKIHELHLPDDDVSRNHANINWVDSAGENGAFQVCDVGSTNGVSVNGERLSTHKQYSQGRDLHAGDTLTIGKSTFQVKLKKSTIFRWEEEEASAREIARKNATVNVPRLTREERAAIPRREISISSLHRTSGLLDLPDTFGAPSAQSLPRENLSGTTKLLPNKRMLHRLITGVTRYNSELGTRRRSRSGSRSHSRSRRRRRRRRSSSSSRSIASAGTATARKVKSTGLTQNSQVDTAV
jgi:pSer/pThr/pTyr-binding forkhead associated (FHA) protein